MPYSKKKINSTKLKILRLATEKFIDDGYTKTTVASLCNELGISTGNFCFHFPTKEHILAVLVEELCEFQEDLMEREVNEGASSMLAYCLELITIASICEDDLVARDFFYSIYVNPTTLDIVRKNDTIKTKKIFSSYQPEWTDKEWKMAENLVSGIEYSAITTRESNTPLPLQIKMCLRAILRIYGVPNDLINVKIEKVLAMDYRALGKKILKEFKQYIHNTNETKF